MVGGGARPGAIALVGSGEYTAAMAETDTALMATLGGTRAARVALLPTASGRESNGPTHWNALGLRHFAGLGVADVRATQIIDRESGAHPEQLALLRDATFFYFSGGDPQYVIETLRGSPAWALIAATHAQGAIVAGCSAGAMMLGARTLSIRSAMASGEMRWGDALGVVPGVVVFPHFDRMAGYAGSERFAAMLAAIPADLMGVGIDEDTALVRLASAQAEAPSEWHVMGRQSVTIFAAGEPPRRLHAGDVVTLPA